MDTDTIELTGRVIIGGIVNDIFIKNYTENLGRFGLSAIFEKIRRLARIIKIEYYLSSAMFLKDDILNQLLITTNEDELIMKLYDHVGEYIYLRIQYVRI